MIQLTRSANAWGTEEFEDILKAELEQLGPDQLPLQQGLSVGGYATDGGVNVMIISVAERAGDIHVKAGIFYKGIIAGCSCADDPTPVDEHSEYCEVRVEIDKDTAETKVALVGE